VDRTCQALVLPPLIFASGRHRSQKLTTASAVRYRGCRETAGTIPTTFFPLLPTLAR